MGQNQDPRLGAVSRSQSRSGRSSQGPSVVLEVLGSSSSSEPCRTIFEATSFVACGVRFGLLALCSFSSGCLQSPACAVAHGPVSLLLVLLGVVLQLPFQL